MQDNIKRESYIRFCRENTPPAFFHAEWLDAVCGKGHWDAALVLSGAETRAVMPYLLRKQGPFTVLGMPPLTPYLGPWLLYPEEQKSSSRFSLETRLYEELISQLPGAHKINMQLHHTMRNGLPFYWAGYNLQQRYTFLIKPDTQEALWEKLDGSIRRQIRKAEKQIDISAAGKVDDFFKLNRATFQRKQKAVPYNIDLVRRIDKASGQSFECSILLGRKEDKAVSGIFLVEDQHEVYYLMGGTLPRYLQTGVASLLMWRSILYAAEKKKTFNFEGSMYPSIANFFKSFGGDLTAYLKVQKVNSPFLKFIRTIK